MFTSTYKTLAVTSVALGACGKKGDETTTAPMTPAPMSTSPSDSSSASPSGSGSGAK